MHLFLAKVGAEVEAEVGDQQVGEGGEEEEGEGEAASSPPKIQLRGYRRTLRNVSSSQHFAV